MDGNRRWAREQGKTAQEGHRAGYETFKDFVTWARDAGVPYVIVYAFSTENWKRSRAEREFLFSLLRRLSEEDLSELHEKNIALRTIGDIDQLPEDLPQTLRTVEEETAGNTGITVALAISYGGRAEILCAVNTLLSEHVSTPVDEETFAEHLWTADIPDPDIIIRPGGEQRLSNFLPWQSVYSELFFPETYWPAFTREQFHAVLEEYGNRQRRRGA